MYYNSQSVADRPGVNDSYICYSALHCSFNLVKVCLSTSTGNMFFLVNASMPTINCSFFLVNACVFIHGHGKLKWQVRRFSLPLSASRTGLFELEASKENWMLGGVVIHACEQPSNLRRFPLFQNHPARSKYPTDILPERTSAFGAVIKIKKLFKRCLPVQ